MAIEDSYASPTFQIPVSAGIRPKKCFSDFLRTQGLILYSVPVDQKVVVRQKSFLVKFKAWNLISVIVPTRCNFGKATSFLCRLHFLIDEMEVIALIVTT